MSVGEIRWSCACKKELKSKAVDVETEEELMIVVVGAGAIFIGDLLSNSVQLFFCCPRVFKALSQSLTFFVSFAIRIIIII